MGWVSDVSLSAAEAETHNILEDAYNVSPRVGVAWQLFGPMGRLLKSGAFIAGCPQQALARVIRRHRFDAKLLVLSVEPNNTIFNIAELTSAIESSTIDDISLLYRLPAAVPNVEWRAWEAHWLGTVHVVGQSDVATRLNRCISVACLKVRPWITCVNAAGIDGRVVALDDLSDNSEFKSYLSDLVLQGGTVAYAQTQLNFVSELPERNVADQTLSYTPIHSRHDLEQWVEDNRQRGIVNAVVLGDMSLLAMLLEASCVDEIVHHITHRVGDADSSVSPCIDLDRWTLSHNRMMGDVSRVIYQNPAVNALLQ